MRTKMQRLMFDNGKYVGAYDDIACRCFGDIKKCNMSRQGYCNNSMCYVHVRAFARSIGLYKSFLNEKNIYVNTQNIFIDKYKKIHIYGIDLLKKGIKYNDKLRQLLDENNITMSIKKFYINIRVYNLPFLLDDMYKFYDFDTIKYLLNNKSMSVTKNTGYYINKVKSKVFINNKVFFLKKDFHKQFGGL